MNERVGIGFVSFLRLKQFKCFSKLKLEEKNYFTFHDVSELSMFDNRFHHFLIQVYYYPVDDEIASVIHVDFHSTND